MQDRFIAPGTGLQVRFPPGTALGRG